MPSTSSFRLQPSADREGRFPRNPSYAAHMTLSRADFPRFPGVSTARETALFSSGKTRFRSISQRCRQDTINDAENFFLTKAMHHGASQQRQTFSSDIDVACRDAMHARFRICTDAFDCRIRIRSCIQMEIRMCMRRPRMRAGAIGGIARHGNDRHGVALTHRDACGRACPCAAPERAPSVRPEIGRLSPQGGRQAKKNPAGAGFFVSRNRSGDQNLYWPEKANRFTSLLNLPNSTWREESKMPIFGVSGWMRV